MKIWKLPDTKKDKLSEVCRSGEYFLQTKKDGFFYAFEKDEEGKEKKMEEGVNVKAIEHGSGWLYGNNLRNTVHHHVIHRKVEAAWFRFSPFLSKLFLTQD